MGVEHASLRICGFICTFDLNDVLTEDVLQDESERWEFRLPIVGAAFSDARSGPYASNTSYHALALGCGDDSTFDAKGWVLRGLLLQRRTEDRGDFERCGFFDVASRDNIDTFFETARSTKLDPSDYEDRDDETGKYTVTLI